MQNREARHLRLDRLAHLDELQRAGVLGDLIPRSIPPVVTKVPLPMRRDTSC